MQLIKHPHACVQLSDGANALVIDPGTFTAEAADILRRVSTVLITHEHFDHFDADVIIAALDARTGLVLYGPQSVTEALSESCAYDEGRVRTVSDGDAIDAGGFTVHVAGGPHATIHENIPVPHNVGYLINGAVFHPGDALLAPPAPVDTLLVPTSGPWTKVGEVIGYIQSVAPRQTVQIHDVMLSDIGRNSIAMFLGEGGPTGIPMHTLDPGAAITL